MCTSDHQDNHSCFCLRKRLVETGGRRSPRLKAKITRDHNHNSLTESTQVSPPAASIITFRRKHQSGLRCYPPLTRGKMSGHNHHPHPHQESSATGGFRCPFRRITNRSKFSWKSCAASHLISVIIKYFAGSRRGVVISHKRKEGATHIILLSVSILCFVNSLSGDFVHDDIPAICANPDVMAETPFVELFRNDFWGKSMSHPDSHKSYRPFTTLTFR